MPSTDVHVTHLHQEWNRSNDLIMKNYLPIEFEYKSEIQMQNCSVIQTRFQLLCYRHNDSLETDQHSIPQKECNLF